MDVTIDSHAHPAAPASIPETRAAAAGSDTQTARRGSECRPDGAAAGTEAALARVWR